MNKVNKCKLGMACSTYGETRGAYGIWWAKLRERYLGVDLRIIQKWIFKK
jgi:hypothetical protein